MYQVQKMQMDGTPVQMNLPWGLTPEDLHAIHRSAEHASQQRHSQQQIDNDMQEVVVSIYLYLPYYVVLRALLIMYIRGGYHELL